ncbi:MAG TPA: metal-dependent hydrolase, partial [Pirellulales bacterium]|nr:metal-dependent hydrolase [Pirellulales bacterium]
LKRYTVHRGMFHSLPAALIAAEVAFLIFDKDDLRLRYYTAGAVLIGFLSHLVLDEIWSISFRRGLPRLKKSFGTAMKIWGDNLWANVSTYAKVILLTYLVVQDPRWMAQFNGIGDAPQELAGRPIATEDGIPTQTSGAGAGEISATPPVYYDPGRIGSRPVPRPWQ